MCVRNWKCSRNVKSKLTTLHGHGFKQSCNGDHCRPKLERRRDKIVMKCASAQEPKNLRISVKYVQSVLIAQSLLQEKSNSRQSAAEWRTRN